MDDQGQMQTASDNLISFEASMSHLRERTQQYENQHYLTGLLDFSRILSQ
jgi:hypothetical protein